MLVYFPPHRPLLNSHPTRRSSDLAAPRLACTTSIWPPTTRATPSISPAPADSSTSTAWPPSRPRPATERKSTRLNSSHVAMAYAVLCLKKKKHKRFLEKVENEK